MAASSAKKKRRYWIVSPNVKNDEATVSEWRAASVAGHAAFMGYDPSDKKHNASGYKFAHEVQPDDVILIARRHNGEPEIVGFGVVRGKFLRSLSGLSTPGKPGSLRRLSPFLPRSRAIHGIPLMEALAHTKALAELHPTSPTKSAHTKLCEWMDEELRRDVKWRKNGSVGSKAKDQKDGDQKRVHITGSLGSFREDYMVRTKQQVRAAKKREAKLVQRYRQWLARQGRELSTVLYGKLRCDGYETARRNLIEAKSSTIREHLRMAVGQLSDYAYQGRRKLGESNKAVLVPSQPSNEMITWLESLAIAVIWPCKKEFVDSANGQFT